MSSSLIVRRAMAPEQLRSLGVGHCLSATGEAVAHGAALRLVLLVKEESPVRCKTLGRKGFRPLLALQIDVDPVADAGQGDGGRDEVTLAPVLSSRVQTRLDSWAIRAVGVQAVDGAEVLSSASAESLGRSSSGWLCRRLEIVKPRRLNVTSSSSEGPPLIHGTLAACQSGPGASRAQQAPPKQLQQTAGPNQRRVCTGQIGECQSKEPRSRSQKGNKRAPEERRRAPKTAQEEPRSAMCEGAPRLAQTT